MDISHRKVTKKIKITGADGKALAGKAVRVRQTNHKFLFGCGAFDFIPYVMTGEDKFKAMTDSWLEIFNYGTLPFYWGMFERDEGQPTGF